MNFEDFVNDLVEELSSYFATSVSIERNQVTSVYTEVTIIIKDEYFNYSPSINLSKYYDSYVIGDYDGRDQVLQLIINEHITRRRQISSESFTDPSCLLFFLMNYERNKEKLLKRPYKQFLDLAVVYTYSHGNAMYEVTNEFVSNKIFTEQELFDCARENTIKIFPYKLFSIKDYYMKAFNKKAYEIYYLSNKFSIMGANLLIYNEVLSKIAFRLNRSFYIIPTSMNGVFLLPTNGKSQENIDFCYYLYNKLEIETEFLSNRIYYYSIMEGVIEII